MSYNVSPEPNDFAAVSDQDQIGTSIVPGGEFDFSNSMKEFQSVQEVKNEINFNPPPDPETIAEEPKMSIKQNVSPNQVMRSGEVDLTHVEQKPIPSLEVLSDPANFGFIDDWNYYQDKLDNFLNDRCIIENDLSLLQDTLNYFKDSYE